MNEKESIFNKIALYNEKAAKSTVRNVIQIQSDVKSQRDFYRNKSGYCYVDGRRKRR